MKSISSFATTIIISILFIACKNESKTNPSADNSLDLKKGELVSCGPTDTANFGKVSFNATIPSAFRNDFNKGIALLHSFEYDEAEKMFAKVIDGAPACAMAYWGIAMSNFHSLWAPPNPQELQKGLKAIAIARSITGKTKREADYIEAIAQFYENADQLDHSIRLKKFEKAMESVNKNYPDDKESSIFYALALNASADPIDKTYTNQRKAVALLDPIFQQEPLHPGLAHYIIHNYDYPGLAEMALPAARKYATIAPASAHAQHMPSHIFTRLGLWDECIESNLVSVSSAKCYAETAKIKGHWDEELHGMDYLVYAYLQKKEDVRARQQLEYLTTINEVYPVNFKVAYAFAAIPARYALERKDWTQAAALQLHPSNFPWQKFPWQEAIIHFAKILGYTHLDKIAEAEKELIILKSLSDSLSKDNNKKMEALQVSIQILASEAWIEFKKGKNDQALEHMRLAANMEDGTEKHPVTPGAVIPARELLGEMLLEMHKPVLALEAFNEDLKLNPKRRNGLAGAVAASKLSAVK